MLLKLPNLFQKLRRGSNNKPEVFEKLSRSIVDQTSQNIIRQLRRMMLLEEEKWSVIKRIEEKLDQYPSDGNFAEGECFSSQKSLEEAWISILDNLYKCLRVSDFSSGVVRDLLEDTIQKISKIAQVSSIISVGESYEPLNCRVEDVVESTSVQDGQILEIFKPGYRRKNGEIIRPAHVSIGRRVDKAQG